MYRQYDVVQTTKIIPINEGSLPRGSVGTIVEIYSTDGKTGYDIEFCDDEGYTTALIILELGDFEHWVDQAKPSEPLQVLDFPSGNIIQSAPHKKAEKKSK